MTASLVAEHNEGECCCDFDGSKLGILGFYAVMAEQSNHEESYRIPGTGVYIEGPNSAEEHERWHVDGPDISESEYLEYEKQSRRMLQRKLGFVRAGSRLAHLAANCAWNAAKLRGVTNDAGCMTMLQTCVDHLFTSGDALTWITLHGRYHDDEYEHWTPGGHSWMPMEVYDGLIDAASRFRTT
jgi:hypothetical protein